MSPALLIGIGALAMWGFKTWRGGCDLTGPGSCTVAGTETLGMPLGDVKRLKKSLRKGQVPKGWVPPQELQGIRQEGHR